MPQVQGPGASGDDNIVRSPGRLSRPCWLILFVCGVLGCQESAPTATPLTSAATTDETSRQRRWVSLAPAVTETLFALGAGNRIVGVSDYCSHPADVQKLPRAGTALRPNFEALVQLNPTLILSENNKNTQTTALSKLAPTLALPWLSLAEVTASVRLLGKKAGLPQAGEKLAQRLSTTLRRSPPPNAPRVLLVLGYSPKQLSEVWFIRKNSLHGAALRAAGGRNAIDRDVDGLPKLSLEAVLDLDPEQVVVLISPERTEGVSDEQILAGWRKLTVLSAVKTDKLAIVRDAGIFANGPRILDLVPKLRRALAQLGATPADPG
ncbi:MAG: ABC transporter substrate-binding protein [Polyangiaceae bacterium]|nr:ABC transporter substrate-binding protein [Polyangiaceae bacterium]